jgi:hypothetical protein
VPVLAALLLVAVAVGVFVVAKRRSGGAGGGRAGGDGDSDGDDAVVEARVGNSKDLAVGEMRECTVDGNNLLLVKDDDRRVYGACVCAQRRLPGFSID